MTCLAIDIGGTKMAAALVENHQLTQRTQIATPQTGAKAMHEALAALIDQYRGFDYVAVASTGIIRHGILTALNPKNLGGLAEFPLHDSIARHTDKPIGLLNDVQAAAWAEYQHEWDQHGQQAAENFAFITVSTGVGGGIVLNRRLLTEPNGIAGHVGHSLADPNGPMCGCGRRGCVEAVAAGRAIAAEAAGWAVPCDPKGVFDRFRQGDVQATALVNRSAAAIANLVADLVIGLDMQKIVIGGSVGLAAGYLPLVQKHLENLPHFYRCPLAPAQYAQDAGLIGAAAWVKQNIK